MPRFRLRAVAVLVALFVPALGVCASLAPPATSLAACSATGGEGHSCCGKEPASCPASDGTPRSPRCHACEGLPEFAGGERPALRAPEAATPLPGSVAVDPISFAPYFPRHPHALSASPPLHLLNESLRN